MGTSAVTWKGAQQAHVHLAYPVTFKTMGYGWLGGARCGFLPGERALIPSSKWLVISLTKVTTITSVGVSCRKWDPQTNNTW